MRYLNQAIILLTVAGVTYATPLTRRDDVDTDPDQEPVQPDCGPAPSGHVGGAFSCIPYVAPSALATTVETITATVPVPQGEMPTALIT